MYKKLLANLVKPVLIAGLFVSQSLYAQTPIVQVEKGVLEQGGFVVLKVAPGFDVSYKHHMLKPDGEGRVLIGFSRNDRAKQTITLLENNGKKFKKTLKITKRSYTVQRINGLPKNKVSPDKATLKLIYHDIAEAKKARKINLPNPYFDSGFDWPTKGIISGIYGSQRILNGKPRAPHLGVDIAAPQGTPLHAPADGKITLNESMVLSGNTVMIDHGYGLRSTVMHLHKVFVKQGELVKKGQVIGEVGQTGRATGPHVHWGMSWFNVRLDPSLLLKRNLKPGDRVSPSAMVLSEKEPLEKEVALKANAK
ncbi:M23 family metallopeptidase [Hydrogenovibrio kuenenii]|uniref:M23 family metallopeptidase n=1 Tax=Hydrogenovibrio kuenenii TaxID=63658 RepID=UPI000464F4E7|nr:M23 family metallopeptidase [Hydrogenovibrio kuenenii]